MPRVVHFELPADNIERATRFYREVFGWQIDRYEGAEDYSLINTGEGEPGINGGLMLRGPGRNTTVNTIGVSSVDEYIDKVVAQGGSVVAPKMAIPGVGYLAYCTDSEGNMFGMMQADTNAS